MLNKIKYFFAILFKNESFISFYKTRYFQEMLKYNKKNAKEN